MSQLEVQCPACGETYLLEWENIPAGRGQVPCLNCGGMISVSVPKPAPVTSKPSGAAPPSGKEEVVCPRCKLHFVPRTDGEQSQASSRRTVLVVEDMEYFKEIARDALGEQYEVRTADTAGEALQIMRQGGIDLLVLDLTLENTEDGFGLLNQLRPKPCPILIFTAENETDMYGKRWEELQQSGADDLVIKGMNVGEMLAKKVGELFGVGWEEEASG
jgi:CheY-like chemotaxis protein